MSVSATKSKSILFCGATLSFIAGGGVYLAGDKMLALLGKRFPAFASLSPLAAEGLKIGAATVTCVGGVATTVLVARSILHSGETGQAPEPIADPAGGRGHTAINAGSNFRTPTKKELQKEEMKRWRGEMKRLPSVARCQFPKKPPLKCLAGNQKGFAYRCLEDGTTYELNAIWDAAAQAFEENGAFKSPADQKKRKKLTLVLNPARFRGPKPTNPEPIILEEGSALIELITDEFINYELLREPVIWLEEGRTYEHEDIRNWLNKDATSPVDRTPYDANNHHIIPNYALYHQPNRGHDPYTGEKFRTAYICAQTGYTFELESIQSQVAKEFKEQGAYTCPFSGKRLTGLALWPNKRMCNDEVDIGKLEPVFLNIADSTN